MPNSISGDLADRDHEVDDAIVRQASHPGLLFRERADLRQIRRVDEWHAVFSRGLGPRWYVLPTLSPRKLQQQLSPSGGRSYLPGGRPPVPPDVGTGGPDRKDRDRIRPARTDEKLETAPTRRVSLPLTSVVSRG